MKLTYIQNGPLKISTFSNMVWYLKDDAIKFARE